VCERERLQCEEKQQEKIVRQKDQGKGKSLGNNTTHTMDRNEIREKRRRGITKMQDKS